MPPLLQSTDGVPAWVIGDVVEGDRTADILEGVNVIEVDNKTLPPYSAANSAAHHGISS